jgi:tetratricopeptide (TPR) repeat protein
MSLAHALLAEDDAHIRTLEYLGTALVTRKRQYGEGLTLLDRAVVLSPQDPGLWYGRGWCYEFAAHEQHRRLQAPLPAVRTMYLEAAASFQHCLALKPEGKLADDAKDLLDHVENVLDGL